MEEIKNPSEYTVCKFDGVTETTVYQGDFSYLIKCSLDWRTEKPMLDEGIEDTFKVLTLDEIRQQVGKGMITIFVNSPFSCEILQYGNYGDSWWSLGTVAGYA